MEVALGVALLLGGMLGPISIPIDLHLLDRKDGDHRFSYRLFWAWGLIPVPLDKVKIELFSKKNKPHRKKATSQSQRFSLFRFFRSSGLLNKLCSTLLRILTTIRIVEGHLRVELGLPTPDDTGRVMGYWYSTRHALLWQSRDHIELRPCFQEARLNWSGKAIIRIYPILIVWDFLSFFLSPTFRRAYSDAKA